MVWNSGLRKFSVIIARSCKIEEETGRLKLCILEYVDRPGIETEEVFYITKEDLNKYMFNKRCPTGSALIFIGNLEICDQELKINEMRLIYCHEVAFSSYMSSVDCFYNIRSFYERQKALKKHEEELQRKEQIEEERKQEAIKAARKRLDAAKERQKQIEEAERMIANESASTDEKMRAIAFLKK